jgi:hypothetical protein
MEEGRTDGQIPVNVKPFIFHKVIKYSPGSYSRSYSAHLTDEETRGQKG